MFPGTCWRNDSGCSVGENPGGRKCISNNFATNENRERRARRIELSRRSARSRSDVIVVQRMTADVAVQRILIHRTPIEAAVAKAAEYLGHDF
jgi:hypothetical protein